MQTGSGDITDDTLERWELAVFDDEPIDRVIYLDNRKLPTWLHTQVWLVEPFRQDHVPLMTDKPVHFHLITHTLPWLAILIYEPFRREEAGAERPLDDGGPAEGPGVP